MIDSVTTARAEAPDASTSARIPSRSRTTRITGWMNSSIAYPWRPSSIVTESTRNGMSSETISTTVYGELQCSRAGSGLNTDTVASPGRRRVAASQ